LELWYKRDAARRNSLRIGIALDLTWNVTTIRYILADMEGQDGKGARGRTLLNDEKTLFFSGRIARDG